MKTFLILFVMAVGFLGTVGLAGYLISKEKEPTISNKTLNVVKPVQIQPTKTVVALNEVLLNVTAPINGQVVNAKFVTVKGKTVPRAEVYVNEKDLVADSEGVFTTSVNLEEGENVISIVVIDDSGESNAIDLKIVRE